MAKATSKRTVRVVKKRKRAAPAAPRQEHVFVIRTAGLSHEDAARVHYLISRVVDAFTDDYDTASDVSLKVLRSVYPKGGWEAMTDKDWKDIVT